NAYHQLAPRLRAASSIPTSSCASDDAVDRNTSGENRTKYANGTIANVPTSTRPTANGEGLAKAVIRLTATTVPGNAHGNITARSMTVLPRKRILAITYAEPTPSNIAPATAMALISRLVVTARHEFGFVNKPAKFCSVYWDGSGAVRQDPFTENAKRKIIAIGRTRKIVETEATITSTVCNSRLVTRRRFLAPPFDSVL